MFWSRHNSGSSHQTKWTKSRQGWQCVSHVSSTLKKKSPMVFGLLHNWSNCHCFQVGSKSLNLALYGSQQTAMAKPWWKCGVTLRLKPKLPEDIRTPQAVDASLVCVERKMLMTSLDLVESMDQTWLNNGLRNCENFDSRMSKWYSYRNSRHFQHFSGVFCTISFNMCFQLQHMTYQWVPWFGSLTLSLCISPSP